MIRPIVLDLFVMVHRRNPRTALLLNAPSPPLAGRHLSFSMNRHSIHHLRSNSSTDANSMLRLLVRFAQLLRKYYWWLRRPTTRGVRAILVNRDGTVLLVRHTYQDGWFLPGGKAGRTEPAVEALQRELREEVGVTSATPSSTLGEYFNASEYKKDVITVFVVRSFESSPTKHFEIAEHRFFSPTALPPATSPGTRRRIEEWQGTRDISTNW